MIQVKCLMTGRHFREGGGVTVLNFILCNLFIINCHCHCFIMLFCILCEIV